MINLENKQAIVPMVYSELRKKHDLCVQHVIAHRSFEICPQGSPVGETLEKAVKPLSIGLAC